MLGYFNRGRIFSVQNQYEAALADFDKAIELDPQSASCYFERAKVRKAMHNYLGAIEDYTISLKLDESNELATKQRAEIYALISFNEVAAMPLPEDVSKPDEESKSKSKPQK